MILLLVRHGEAEWNVKRRVMGRGSQKLTKRGQIQAAQVAKALQPHNVDYIYSSPITRACETASVIEAELGVPIQLSEMLVELDAGQLEGLTSEEMQHRYPEFMALWKRDRVNAAIPGGESLLHVEQRVDSFYRFVKKEHSYGNIVVVSHNFPIRILLSKIMGAQLALFDRISIDLASISRVDLSEDGDRLMLLNDVCHLAALVDRA